MRVCLICFFTDTAMNRQMYNSARAVSPVVIENIGGNYLYRQQQQQQQDLTVYYNYNYNYTPRSSPSPPPPYNAVIIDADTPLPTPPSSPSLSSMAPSTRSIYPREPEGETSRSRHRPLRLCGLQQL